MNSPVSIAEPSANAKLGAGRASATMAPIPQTCPTDCAMATLCYAKRSFSGIQSRRLAKNAEGLSEADVARAEAAGIDGLRKAFPLRLHVSGDCRTEEAARIVSDAASRYHARSGAPVWTYTHAHRTVGRKAWGTVSVLASCETTGQAREALAAGYAAAMVVPHEGRTTAWIEDGLRIVPCPHQTGKAPDCVTCSLCMRDEALRAGRIVIGFDPH